MSSIVLDHRAVAAPSSAPGAGALARLAVLTDMVAAEPCWRQLEQDAALATPYQRYDLLAAWQHHAGARSGVVPFIVIGFDAADRPLFLLPLGRMQTGPLRIASFLGSKHANFNIGLWRREALATMGAQEIRDVLASLASHGIDLLMLMRQPPAWDGMANPLAAISHQPAAEGSARLDFPAAGGELKILSTSTRSRLRTKERKLQKLPGYRYLCAATAEEIDYLLERFFALKTHHMAALGMSNVFGKEGVRAFLQEACHRRLANGRHLIEIHALVADDEVLALFGCIVDDYRASCMFNTYTLGESSRYSPGLILLTHMVDAFAARGIRSFDIGVGRAHYKSFFCPEPEPLFDAFVPVTALGRLASAALGTANLTKRMIKQNRMLWAGVLALRRVRARG